MSNITVERVLEVHHWNDTLFSFKCTREDGLRFINGQSKTLLSAITGQ